MPGTPDIQPEMNKSYDNMKHIKLFTAIGLSALAVVCGCSRVSDLEDRMDDIESRVDALEALCLQLNSDISALQTLVQSQTDGNIYISAVEDVENGYKITFSNGKTYVIQDGEKGSKGDKGDQGENGEDAQAPVISIRQDSEDNGWYWTLNGEWLLVDGAKVSALGVTPQLRINSETDNWEVSYDSGATWTVVAAAYDKSHNITVTQDENAVYFTLADGTVFTVNKAIAYKFFVNQTDDIPVAPGATVSLSYTIADGDESVRFSVQCGGGFSASVTPSSVSAGVITVTAPNPFPADGSGYVLIIATKNSTGDVKAQQLTFEQGVLTASEVSYTAPADGGNVLIPVSTNLSYTVDIPAEAQSWISVAPETKAVRQDTVTLVVAQNLGEARSATVTLTPSAGEALSLTIAQAAASGVVSFEADATSADIECTAESYTVKLKSTVSWTASASDGVTLNPASGTGSADIVATFPANTDADNTVTRTITITTEDAAVTDKTITVTLTQAKYVSPYNFTYVRWGNNVGLDTAKYPAMYRVEMGGEALKVPVAASDIPEGAPVTYSRTNQSNASTRPTNLTIDSSTGAVTITPITSDKNPGAHVCCITVKVGGDSPYAVTKTFPFFVDQQGVNAQGYRVQADPFVFVVNPTAGGTSGAITCTKDGVATEHFNIDFRRNTEYYNYYGPTQSADGTVTYADGRLDKMTTTSYLYGFWNKYYSARNQSVNTSATNPISYWNNSTNAAALALTLGYIDPATLKMSINAGAFVDTDGRAASGALFGTFQYNVTENTNPINTSLGEVRPMIIYFDPTFE